jgi:hypothetical protein
VEALVALADFLLGAKSLSSSSSTTAKVKLYKCMKVYI